MFLAAADSASFVDTASRTGFILRRWLFTAMQTGVSIIPSAIFASVFPVQGDTTSISNIRFGPMGSAAVISWIIGFPQRSQRRLRWLCAVPKRVSSVYALSDIIGVTSQPSVISRSRHSIEAEKVQNEPQSA